VKPHAGKGRNMAIIEYKSEEELSELGLSTLSRLFQSRVKEWASQVAMREKVLGIWQKIIWEQYGNYVYNVASAFIECGLKKGDRVVIVSENCPKWLYCDHGVLAAGGIPIGVYPTDSASQVEYVINNCEAKIAVVGGEEQLDKVLEFRNQMPQLEKIIIFGMKGLRNFKDYMSVSFTEFHQLGEEVRARHAETLQERIESAQPDDTAIIVYTSGTTGPPKGVMLSHENILVGASRQFEIEPPVKGKFDEILTFLPLCHVAERSVSSVGPLLCGSIINFAESMSTVPQDIREVSPGYFFAVPRIWEKFHSTLMLRMDGTLAIEQIAFKWALKLGQKLSKYRLKLKSPPIALSLMFSIVDFLVLKNIKRSIGLDRVRYCFSGAAPVSPDLLKFYYSLGIDMREFYGQTECTGMATFHYRGRTKFGTVGEAVPGLEVKIAENGEILIKGASVFKGYYKNPEKTAETVIDGWLHTGDLGKIDEDGHVIIQDRLKDIIITSGGKNIMPSEIENQLKFSPYISDSIVIGDRRKFLTALIMIDEENAMKYAQEHKVPFTTYASLTRSPEINKLIGKEVEKTNKNFARVETIKMFKLIDIQLTSDDDELTATGKLKRKFVSEKFKDLIDAMYSNKSSGPPSGSKSPGGDSGDEHESSLSTVS
jgi:long-chain acyl-CoA synthetase